MNAVSDVPKEVLKQLVLEFQQETNDKGSLFERILVRVDRLLQYVMAKERRNWPHLRIEDPQDIYQAACAGLCNGIATVKSTDTPDQVILRIFAYVQAEIRKEFPVNRYKYYTYMVQEKQIEEPVYRQLESEYLREVYQSLIVRGIISQKEYNLLCQRYIEGLEWKVIAAGVQMNIDCVRKLVEDARNRMRHQLRLRGITTEE